MSRGRAAFLGVFTFVIAMVVLSFPPPTTPGQYPRANPAGQIAVALIGHSECLRLEVRCEKCHGKKQTAYK